MSEAPTTEARTARGRRFVNWLPVRVDVRIRVAAWISLILEIAIVGTGGAVRLTDSGLGCEWPLCTPDSLFPTAEQDVHSVIEFGNRALSFFVGLAAVAVLVLIWRLRRERRDLWTLAWIVLGGVILQAGVGGILVIFDLHPNLVSFHYIVSLVLVGIAAVFLTRMDSAGRRERVVPAWLAIATHITSAVLAVTVLVGVLTTGAGPHSGDPEVTLRNGFDASILEHVHSWPAYALFALTLVLVAGGWTVRRQAPGLLRWSAVLLLIELVQIAIGLYQARNDLPPLAVGIHMVLAAILVATMVAVVSSIKAPVAARTS